MKSFIPSAFHRFHRIHARSHSRIAGRTGFLRFFVRLDHSLNYHRFSFPDTSFRVCSHTTRFNSALASSLTLSAFICLESSAFDEEEESYSLSELSSSSQCPSRNLLPTWVTRTGITSISEELKDFAESSARSVDNADDALN